MRSEFLSQTMTSCGVCGNVIYGRRSLGRGTIRTTRPVYKTEGSDSTTGKRTEYEGKVCWVHYPGPCWLKTQKAPEVPDGKAAAANDRD